MISLPPAPSAEARALTQAARRYAWLCLHGDAATARFAAETLGPAIEKLAAVDPAAASPDAVATLFAIEDRRAADAAALAEILAPEIAARLHALGGGVLGGERRREYHDQPARPTGAPPAAIPDATSGRKTAGDSTSPFDPPRAPTITDLIDGMFAEESRVR